MKTVKLSNVAIPDVPNNTPPYAYRNYPKQGFPLHFRMSIIGGVGSGKTTFLLKLIGWYSKAKSFDRCVFFSPTLEGENKGDAFINAKHSFDLEVYKKYSDAVMREEADMMKQRIEDWKEWERKKEVWKKYKNAKSMDEMDYDDLILLENMGYEKPKNEFPNGYPSNLLVLDDLVGAKGVFSANCRGYLTEFILQSRHHSCSVIILSQVFKNFLPAQLRQGSFDKWVLFGTKSKHRESIAEECTDKVEVEKFLQIWDFATEKSHECLFVDYTAPLEFMFRKGLDHIIQFNNDE
jgi:Ni2+-binding GTPase involved in maturation of urease and hydrogenase